MKKMLTLTVCLAVTFAFANGTNAATITALSTFGGGDGWIAPGQTLKLGPGIWNVAWPTILRPAISCSLAGMAVSSSRF